ncbi:MAG TPA: hypothetical protein VF728_03915, partial [Nocardioides sp.]
MTVTPALRAPLRPKPSRPLEARPATLVDRMLAAADAHPEQVALTEPGGATTWGELAARVHDAAAAYAGARRLVLLVPGNDVASVVEYLGALLADQVVLLAAAPAVPGLVDAWDPDVVADPTSRHRAFRRTTPGGAVDPSATAHDLHP